MYWKMSNTGFPRRVVRKWADLVAEGGFARSIDSSVWRCVVSHEADVSCSPVWGSQDVWRCVMANATKVRRAVLREVVETALTGLTETEQADRMYAALAEIGAFVHGEGFIVDE